MFREFKVVSPFLPGLSEGEKIILYCIWSVLTLDRCVLHYWIKPWWPSLQWTQHLEHTCVFRTFSLFLLPPLFLSQTPRTMTSASLLDCHFPGHLSFSKHFSSSQFPRQEIFPEHCWPYSLFSLLHSHGSWGGPGPLHCSSPHLVLREPASRMSWLPSAGWEKQCLVDWSLKTDFANHT